MAYRQSEAVSVACLFGGLLPDVLLVLLEHHGLAHHAHRWTVQILQRFFLILSRFSTAAAAALWLLPWLRQRYKKVLLQGNFNRSSL